MLWLRVVFCLKKRSYWLKIYLGAGEMVQWVKGLAAQALHMCCLIPASYI